MAVNLRRICGELQDLKPRLFISTRKSETIASVKILEYNMFEYAEDTLYIISSEFLESTDRLCIPVNILLVDGNPGEAPPQEFKKFVINAIAVTSALSVVELRKRIDGIIQSGITDDAYFSKMLFNLAYTGGFQNIADTAYTMLGNPISAYDLSLRSLAYSKNQNPISEAFLKYTQDETLIEKRTMRFFEVNYLEKIRRHGGPVLIETAVSTRLIIAPVYVNGVFWGFVDVMEAYVTFDETDLILIGEICKVISIEMKKDDFFKNSREIMHEHFLIELLERSTHSQEYVEARLRALDLKIEKDLYIVTIESKDQMARFEQMTQHMKGMRSFMKIILSTVYRDKIVLLMHNDSRSGSAIQEKDIENFSNYLQSCCLIAGVSNRFNNPRHIKKHYQQALIALESALSLKNPGQIFHYQQLCIYHLIALSNLSSDVLDYVHPSMLLLIRYDQDNKTEFMKTLYHYLTNLKALLRTKDELYIHRNTLVYRIKKIEEIMGVDLNDGETFFQLYFSLKALEYQSAQLSKKSDGQMFL